MGTYGDASLGLLGDPTRRAIFELLARRPSSVGELAQQLPISRPAVSQHLRVLKDGGLVTSRAEGTRRVYQLNPTGVNALGSLAHGLPESRRGGARFRRGAAMTTASAVPAINATLTVSAPVERAFRVFTESFDTWWPAEYHIGSVDMAATVLEPRAGGR